MEIRYGNIIHTYFHFLTTKCDTEIHGPPIENAAGFASQIQVTTSINEIPKKHKKELLFSVADNGCGIDESEYDKIFERFYSNRRTSSKAEASELGHTGLGLSIVKAITDACEGTIKISRSTSLGGAEFTVGLPL